jgi:hypothetical protein
MAAGDTLWGPRDANGKRRQYTVEELDALEEFRWPGAGVMGRLAAGMAAMRSRVRPRARIRINPTALPSAEATALV